MSSPGITGRLCHNGFEAVANSGVSDNQVSLPEASRSSSLLWCLAMFPTYGGKPLEVHKKHYPPPPPD